MPESKPELEELEVTEGGKKFAAVYDPNYSRKCQSCGQKPCVRIRRKSDNSIFYDGEMCGACTWGDASALDPKNW